ncbi:hypothetical protein GCM10010363_29830 [Streptomyces omiyaensis]|nr:hypothetical protein GCM10010363_29830 [Streptomyces omiyaensis]
MAAQVHVGPAVEKEFTGHSARVTTGDGPGQVRTGMWEMRHRAGERPVRARPAAPAPHSA